MSKKYHHIINVYNEDGRMIKCRREVSEEFEPDNLECYYQDYDRKHTVICVNVYVEEDNQD